MTQAGLEYLLRHPLHGKPCGMGLAQRMGRDLHWPAVARQVRLLDGPAQYLVDPRPRFIGTEARENITPRLRQFSDRFQELAAYVDATVRLAGFWCPPVFGLELDDAVDFIDAIPGQIACLAAPASRFR